MTRLVAEVGTSIEQKPPQSGREPVSSTDPTIFSTAIKIVSGTNGF